MKREPPNPLKKAEQYREENLALARQILATDEQGLRRQWAELVVAKEESNEAQKAATGNRDTDSAR